MEHPRPEKTVPNDNGHWCSLCEASVVRNEYFRVPLIIGAQGQRMIFHFCPRCFHDNDIQIGINEDYDLYVERIVRIVTGMTTNKAILYRNGFICWN